ncbi:hypothetical protein M409DRAFT_19526 [Zasmidium cellare ATCC 36951]|uniref:Heterokaryon incompatibility domain-containing protein n=1 Tax=Zasmidium cellare ATCC 36951 TaxID=1080233 RepID=A0A6A6CXW2_ZASCE|nr:uncharacterized protein M409DRAFT_19526 [Zasmidium cellare ATCC 36951]KAF2170712.1 hypothetical protein M409DRAFT_19526 [Zasmidium cellare ATCC 36951]
MSGEPVSLIKYDLLLSQLQRMRLMHAQEETAHCSDVEHTTLQSGDDSLAMFQHEPLSRPARQVRLLRISEGDDDDNLTVDLITSDLSEAPGYFAVSYTWGDGRQHQQLNVNDKVMSVRQNCYYALWQIHMKYPTQPYVWIDSLCINQDDLEEKAFQIQLMERIFIQAKSVLACIGPHADDSELVVDAVRKAKKHDPKAARAASLATVHFEDSNKFRDFMNGEHWETFLESMDKDSLANLNAAFQKLTRRRYWKRLWVVQEIAASKRAARVLIGEDDLTWTDVDLLLQLMREVGRHGVKRHLWKSAGKQQWQHLWILKTMFHLHAWSLSLAISFTWDRECQDPRDHVYGILSLVKWTKPPILPDYIKSRFDVAIEAIAHLDQWFAIFATLHFVRLQDDARCTEMFSPWRQTCNGGQEKTDVPLDPWQSERLVVELNGDSGCTHVLAGEDGVLTIPIMYAEASPPETTELKNRISAAYMSAFHQCIREGLSKPPKLLRYQHHTVAIVSGNTKASDIVLPLLSIRFGNSPVLILRRSENAFHIIGQGGTLCFGPRCA